MVWGDGFLEWYRRDEPEHLRRGRMGERAAKQELKKAGLKFLYANFRGEAGEIDLIFRDKRTLVFVEVKTRSSETWTRPATAVNADKRRKLIATGREYIRLLGKPSVPVRYDIAEVLLENGAIREVRHQPSAFKPGR